MKYFLAGLFSQQCLSQSNLKTILFLETHCPVLLDFCLDHAAGRLLDDHLDSLEYYYQNYTLSLKIPSLETVFFLNQLNCIIPKNQFRVSGLSSQPLFSHRSLSYILTHDMPVQTTYIC